VRRFDSRAQALEFFALARRDFFLGLAGASGGRACFGRGRAALKVGAGPLEAVCAKVVLTALAVTSADPQVYPRPHCCLVRRLVALQEQCRGFCDGAARPSVVCV